MGKHEQYGFDDFLIAASGAGRMGFSATESALKNLARCSICPFWNTCDNTHCKLMIPIDGIANSPDSDGAYQLR